MSAPSRTTASECHTPQLSRDDEIEARRIAGELDRLHRDGAIASKAAHDPDAVFYARLLRDFGATYTGRERVKAPARGNPSPLGGSPSKRRSQLPSATPAWPAMGVLKASETTGSGNDAGRPNSGAQEALALEEYARQALESRKQNGRRLKYVSAPSARQGKTQGKAASQGDRKEQRRAAPLQATLGRIRFWPLLLLGHWRTRSMKRKQPLSGLDFDPVHLPVVKVEKGYALARRRDHARESGIWVQHVKLLLEQRAGW